MSLYRLLGVLWTLSLSGLTCPPSVLLSQVSWCSWRLWWEGEGVAGVTEMMAGVSWLLGEGERVSSWMTGMILLECLTELSPHLSSRTLVTSWDS